MSDSLIWRPIRAYQRASDRPLLFQQASVRLFVATLGVLSGFLCGPAVATFSIAACDADTGSCGVAVATHNLAVGNSVPFAVSELGAGVSQFETNPQHADRIVAALRAGFSAAEALSNALESDAEFADGQGLESRQVAVVESAGDAAAYTGVAAADYAGHKTDEYVSVQGNGLVSAKVLDSMLNDFNSREGSLAERLLRALEAGYVAGGQTIGVTSAALLVATPEGWPIDIDLRVDFAPGTAIDELRGLLDASTARTLVFRARRAKDPARVRELAAGAISLAPEWDRIWLAAAHLAVELGDHDDARLRFAQFAALNPIWADRLSDEFEASLEAE